MTSRAPITEIQRMVRAKIMREINDRLVSEDTVVEKKSKFGATGVGNRVWTESQRVTSVLLGR